MLRSILRRFKSSLTTEDASVRVLTEIIQSCPQCGRSLHSHEYRLIAGAVLKTEQLEHFRELMSAIRNHDWQKVVTYQSWEGNQPNAEVYGIRCPEKTLSVIVVSAPFALEEPYTLMHQETIDDPATFERYLPNSDHWHPL